MEGGWKVKVGLEVEEIGVYCISRGEMTSV